MTTSPKKDEIGEKIPQIKVDWTPTTGLRGLCAIQIVIGHFFYGFAPRSTHEHCFNDFDPITGEQTAIGDPNYPYLVNLPMNQAVVLFFILSGCLYGYLYFDRFQGAEQKIPFEDEDHNDHDHHYLPSASENSTDDVLINKLKEPLLLKSGYEVGMGAEKVEKPRPKSISLREFSVKRLARLIPIWYMSLLIMLPFWLLDERLPWINKLGGALTNIFLTQSVLGAPNGFVHTHPVMIGPGWQISAFMLSYLTLPSMVKWTKVLILACHSFRKRVWENNNTTSTNHGNNYSPNSANSRVRIQVSLFFYLLLSPEGILLFLMFVPAMIIPWWLANWVANLPNSNFGVSHCTWIVRVWIVWQGVWLGMLIKRRDEWGKLEWKHSNDRENLKTNLNVNADSMRDSMMERRKYKSVFHFYHAWSHMQGSLTNLEFLSRKFLVNSLFGLYVGYFFIYPIVGSESFDMFAEYFTPPLQLLWFYVLVVSSVKEEEPLVSGSSMGGNSTVAGANAVPFCPRFLNSSVFQKLGDYSYGVYCGHFPCFWIVGWVLTPGFPFGKGAGYYVLNRCLNGPSMGDGFFGLDYIDFPICLVAALTMGYILVTLDDYLGLRATMEKKFL